MQSTPSLFKAWLPQKWIAPLFMVALFPHLTLLTLFNMNSTFTASFLDVDVDDLQFLFSLGYAMIVCTLFIHTRFFQYFNVRNYLLLMTSLSIGVLLLMSLTTNHHVLVILRFIQGPIALLEGVILIPIVISQLKSQHAKLLSYSVLYAIMLTGDKFTTSLVRFAIENYNYTMILYTVIGFHIAILAFYLAVFKSARMFPKKPLYQLNLGGIFLLVIALICGVFFLVYGKRYNWFESAYICWAFMGTFLFSGLFILHQRNSKRPLFHFEILLSKRVIIGLALFMLLYLMRASMSNLYQIMAQVWGWHWEFVLEMQYFNVIGSLAGIALGYFALVRKVPYTTIFLFGFGLLSATLYYFSRLFGLDTDTSLVAIGLVAQGLAQGVLFTPLVFYMLGSVHPSITGSVAQSGTAIRFWSSTIGFAVMQNALLYLTTKHQMSMAFNLTPTNPDFQLEWDRLYTQFSATHLANEATQLTASAMEAQIYRQALLLSNMEIFRSLVVLGSVLCMFIVASITYKQIKALRTRTRNGRKIDRLATIPPRATELR